MWEDTDIQPALGAQVLLRRDPPGLDCGRTDPAALDGLQAEIADRKGDAASAGSLWLDLPAGRKLYGILRQKGLLPPPAAGAGPQPGGVSTDPES